MKSTKERTDRRYTLSILIIGDGGDGGGGGGDGGV